MGEKNMQQLGILYLDREKDKALFKGLNRFGSVFHVKGINQALFLMAEHDFEYYFIDADAPQARAFIQHLRHDPELLPSMGLILLTDNEEEDCEAWSVDTFLNRSTAVNDLSYVFTHIKGEPGETARILSIAPSPVEERPSRDGAVEPTEEPDEPAAVAGDDDMRESLDAHRKDTGTASAAGSTRSAPNRQRAQRTRMLALASVLLVALGTWLFTAGPLGTKAYRHQSKSSRKTVDAETAPLKDLDTYRSSGATSMPVPPVANTVPAAAPAGPAVSGEVSGAPPADTSEEQVAPSPPAATPVNHPPNVSISGPATVQAGQSATYSASGSDPDGDSFSLSWASKTLYFGGPGQQSVSVTITDSKGASNSASLLITVIP
jgi:hypothetical protein